MSDEQNRVSLTHEANALHALVRAALGCGYGADEVIRLGAHYVAGAGISTDVHEQVWRAEGLWPEVDDRWDPQWLARVSGRQQ